MPGEIPFRHLYTSVIREFKHNWYGEISQLNQEFPHNLVRSYLSLNVSNVLVFVDFLHAFPITEHPKKTVHIS